MRVLERLVDEGVASREVWQDVRVVDIVERDVQVLETAQSSPIIGKLPV
jgi:hypothetical protein